jgi:hypothetical protein
MRPLRITAFSVVLVVAALAQTDNRPTVSIKELPPEAIPVGACTESTAGFLGVVETSGKERTQLSAEEIGKYVSKRLSEGYSIALYPQTSGRIFVTADCHPAKPRAIP